MGRRNWRKLLAKVDPRKARLMSALELHIAEPRIELEILRHGRVGIQLDSPKALSLCLCFGKPQQSSAETVALMLGAERNVLDEVVIVVCEMHDKACHIAGALDHVHETFRNLSGKVSDHWCWLLADAGNVHSVGLFRASTHSIGIIGHCGSNIVLLFSHGLFVHSRIGSWQRKRPMSIRITLLGTGCPVAHPERRGPAQLIEAGGQTLLVDCGSGVTQQLVATGSSGADIDALLITHYHSDHLVDFYQLIVSSWHQGRNRPWIVYAPDTVHRHMAAQMSAWKDERELRIAFEQRGGETAGLEVDPRPLSEGSVLRAGSLTVSAILVDHGPINPAFGFTFETDDARLVFSGDTAPCEAIVEAARGADLLLHEVFVHRHMLPEGAKRSAETIGAIASYHTGVDEVAKIAARADAKALALTHFVPPLFDKQQLLADLRPHYKGPVIIAEDLMRISLPDRSIDAGGVVLGY